MERLSDETLSMTPLSREERALGAYLGLAVGDALGATTEFLMPREIKEKYGTHDKIIGGGWLRLNAGQVTDDTEMTLALGKSIIESQAVISERVSDAFSDWMRTKPVDIGNTVRRGIIHYRSTGNAIVEENEYDAGNGACMRCLPIALFCCYSSEADRVQASRIQSHTTHNNSLSDAGTEAVLSMIVSSLHGCEKSHLETLAAALVSKFSLYRFDKRRIENPSGFIVETLQVVFQSFFSLDSYEKILIDVVNRGGDADTTGAIAGMIAGAYYGPKAIPARWRTKIDPDVISACTNQASDLLSLGRSKYSTSES